MVQYPNFDEKLAGTCGVYCGACGIYQNNLQGNPCAESRREKHTETDSELKFCNGCGDKRDNSWSSQCPIGRCADLKNIRYCFQCKEFPCDLLQDFSELNQPKRETIKNLYRMKEIGLKKWLAEADETYRCPSCRKRIEFHQKNCQKCSNILTLTNR
ncbi:MAG: hypothetical protein A2161_14980 [Candidatus Schekmanbacteria bacterium RBG_13_48_7]|uniref:GON domain-containing protein n=1 Tax=Candidatus Schekmanbacteria bacterium RBG_13_48_7 TaxID=1817878 RepID=A0A1F7RW50_9BACT|nr:MAG: hypothetical protein A2161_14980 [Candidatus Schekmanbacteria bacterium RBG_13_48_7]